MELTSTDAVQALIMQASVKPAAPRATRGGRRVRCSCGKCLQCKEDARWERIFTEKFADPNYYRHHLTHTSSPLASF